jgi:hypothetical protein
MFRPIFNFFSVFVLLSAAASPLFAQSNAPSIMTFEINAIANDLPTSYLVVLHVSQVATTPEEAEQLMKERVKALTKNLQKINANQIHTEFVSLQPIYQKIYGKAKKNAEPAVLGEQLIGFDYRQNIRIAYNYPEQLSKIMIAASKQDIFEVVHTESRHNSSEAIFENLRGKCFDYMRLHLPRFEDQGIDVLDWERFMQEERQVFYPESQQKNFSSRQNSALNSPTPTAKKTLPLISRQDHETKVYRRQPLETFEIVVNPELIEPAIQFVYTMKIQMVVPQEGTKIEYKNEFIMPAPAPARPTYTPPITSPLAPAPE